MQIAEAKKIFNKIKDLDGFNLTKYQILQKDFFDKIGLTKNISEYSTSHETNDNYYLSNISLEALNTALIDLINILKLIPQNSIIADIGSGHSLMSICCNLLELSTKIISIEPVADRLISAKKVNEYFLSQHEFINAKFEEMDSINFEYAFLYLPGGKLIENIISKLHITGKPKYILAVESHGDLIARLDNHSSLKNKKVFCELLFPRLDSNCYIYEFIPKELNPFNIFIKNLYSEEFVLLSVDAKGPWIASLKDVYVFFENKENIIIECQYPPRTFKLKTSNFEEIRLIRKIDLNTRCSELIIKIEKNAKINDLYLRKIYLNQHFCELSDSTILAI